MPALLDLVDHEKLTSMSVGRRAAWVLANTGRCWFRTGLNQENYPSTVVATKASIPRVNHWVAIPGRLKVLQSSPNDEVFAVDRVSSRLLFRSGISSLTPGGEAWLPLQLPILWTVGEGPQPLQPEEGKRLYSNKHLPLHECIELLSTVLLQFEANKASVCPSPPSEQATANEFDGKVHPELHSPPLQDNKPSHTPNKLARRFQRLVASSTKQQQQQRTFPHLHHLLHNLRRHAKQPTDSHLREVFSPPRPGLPPPSMHWLSAGALNSCHDMVPVLWRVAGFVFSDLSRASLFTAAPEIVPDWLSSLSQAFDKSSSELSLLPTESVAVASPEPPWTCTYKVDVLAQTGLSFESYSPEASKLSPERGLWTHGESVVVIGGAGGSSRKVKLLTAAAAAAAAAAADAGRSRSLSHEDPAAANASATFIKKWDCVDCQDIFWCGNIDSTSCLIPKLSHNNAPLNSPSKPTPRTLTQRQHSAHGFTPHELATFDLSLPQDMFTHNYDSGHLIGVFFKRKSDSLVAFHRPQQQQQFSSLEEDSDSAFIDTFTADRNKCIPHAVWVLRFASKVEASSWLDLVSRKGSKVITEGPCCNGRGVAWLVSELREIFCARLPADTSSSNTAFDLRWSKVAGHLALIESVHTRVGQITWGLGHDGTPWAFRPDWAVDKSAFSSRKFEFDLQHFQTDCRQVEIYEYQAWRMLKGFSSSRPIGDCQAMWSRDGRRLQACGLTEVQLPSAFCHWQTPWRVDCSCHSEHAVSTLLPLPSKSRDLERSAPIRLDGGSIRSYSSSSSSPVLEHVDTFNSGSDPTLHLPTTMLKPKGTLPIPAECPGVECSCDISSMACDEEGWQYASRLTSWHFGLRLKWNSGARRRRWTRTYAVRLKAPWQEIGALRLRSLCFITSAAESVNVWAITLSGELVCRLGVSTAYPAGTSWRHYPVNRELLIISACPSGRLWALCRRFGRLWVTTRPVAMVTTTDDDDDAELTWVSMGLSPQGLAWSLASVGRLAGSAEEVSSSSGNCVIWCVDTGGQLWMSTGPEFSDEGLPATPQDGTAPLRWSLVSAPMISHLSCGPDGQVWAVFFENHCLAMRVGITQSCPQGTGWRTVLQGTVSSASIRGATSL